MEGEGNKVPTSTSQYPTTDELTREMLTTFPRFVGAARRDWHMHHFSEQIRAFVFELLSEKPRTQAELIGETHANPSGMSKMIDVLEKKGYVERKIDPDDRRRVIVTITEAGRKANRHRHAEAIEQMRGTFADLTPEERKTLSDALVIFRRIMEQKHAKFSSSEEE